MDKSAIDTASREIDLRNIPVHLRTALRRALEFEARAPAPRSAEEAEQCEEQLRAIADEFFGALLTPVLQRAVCSAAVGDAASALVRHLPRRMRSDGLETVNVRTSRGTTVPVTTPYYREKHARRAKRRPGLYPALVVLGIYDRCTPKLASDASRAVAMLSSLAEAQAQLRSDGIALDIKTLRSTAYRYAARARAAQQSAACGLLDRVTGKRVVVSLDGGRVKVQGQPREPADLHSWPLLYDLHWKTYWSHWFAHQGAKDADLSHASGFRLYSMMVQAAVDGMGVALGHSLMIARELEQGRWSHCSTPGSPRRPGTCWSRRRQP